MSVVYSGFLTPGVTASLTCKLPPPVCAGFSMTPRGTAVPDGRVNSIYSPMLHRKCLWLPALLSSTLRGLSLSPNHIILRSFRVNLQQNTVHRNSKRETGNIQPSTPQTQTQHVSFGLFKSSLMSFNKNISLFKIRLRGHRRTREEVTSEKRHLLVTLHVDAFQLTEAHQVGPHQDPQLLPLPLSLLPVSAVALMLHSHPQLVHFCKVEEYKIHGITDVARRFFTARRQWETFTHRVHITGQTHRHLPFVHLLRLPLMLRALSKASNLTAQRSISRGTNSRGNARERTQHISC